MLSTLLARGTERLLAILSGPTNSFSSLPSSVDVKTGIRLPNFPLANLYGQTFTKTIQSILNEDLEYVKRSPYELEPFDQDEVIRNTASNATPQDLSPQYSTDINPDHRIRASLSYRRRSQSSLDHSLIVSSPDAAPTILITPCTTLSQYTARVPLQDASYGNRLTVPGYPHFNSFFPPLRSASRLVHTSSVTRWIWGEGHWWAVIPDLDTQMRRGWFSRPLNARRAVRSDNK